MRASKPSSPADDASSRLDEAREALKVWAKDTPGGLWIAIVLSVAIYWPTLSFRFVYDDGWTLLSNGFLREGSLGELLWRTTVPRSAIPDAFRPTSVIFEQGVYALIGLDRVAHHALNLGLHLVVLALLWRWVWRMTGDRLLALGASVWMSLLACHAEVVAVVSYREDLIAAALALAALNLWSTRGGKTRAAPWKGPAVAGLSFLAAGAKWSVLPLPVFYFLTATFLPGLSNAPAARRECAPQPRSTAAGAGWMTLGVVAALVHRSLVFGSMSPYQGLQPPPLDPLSFASVHTGLALSQALVPLGLSPDYAPLRADAPGFFVGLVLLVSGLCAAVLGASLVLARAWRPSPAGPGPLLRISSLALLGFVVLWLPVSNVVPLANPRADRYLYLPSLSVCLALGWGSAHALRRWTEGEKARGTMRASMGLTVLLGLALVHAGAAAAATAPFSNNRSLWEAAARSQPGSARAQALQSLHRLASGRQRVDLPPQLELSVAAGCENALRLNPHEDLSWICRARLELRRGDRRAALSSFKRALDERPGRPDLLRATIAELEFDLGVQPGGREVRAGEGDNLADFPYSPELTAALGRIAHRSGDHVRAMRLYRRARELRPERWETVAGALELALDLGDAPAAWRTWLERDELFDGADTVARDRLRRRLHLATSSPPSLTEVLLSPGALLDASPQP